LELNTNWSKAINNIIAEDDVLGVLDIYSPWHTMMDYTVGNTRVTHDVVFPTKSCFFSVNLWAIEDLNVVHVGLTVPENILIECKASYNLSSPTFNVFTNDLDISCEKYDFSTNIDSIVKVTSRVGSSEMIVFNGVV
jgi:hypothetical protein